MITKAYKYCIDYAEEWYVYKYFSFKIENAFHLENCVYIESLDKDFIVLSHIVKFQYMGEFNIEIDEKNKIKEVSKV